MLSGEVPPAPGQEIPSLARKDVTLTPADRVIRRMLSPQANLRYPTAGQASAALRQALRELVGSEPHSPEQLPVPAYSSEPAEVEWLENPAEIVLNDLIDAAFLQESRDFASQLRQMAPLRRLL